MRFRLTGALQTGRAQAATAILAICALAMAPPARAEEDVFDNWARWVTHQARWRGQTVARPDVQARPQLQGPRLDSLLAPVHVHAPAHLSMDRAQRALAAAELAYAYLRDRGFPLPPTDGMRGGTAGLDVYLGAAPDQALAALDGSDPLSMHDGAIAFAEVDGAARGLEGCVVAGVTQAALLAADPAEAAAWRQLTGAWVARHLTGTTAGCQADMARGQDSPAAAAAPELGFGHARAGHRGSAFLTMLNGRAGSNDGRFLGELWHFARQSSRGARFLRGSPDMWEALDRALTNAGQPLEDLLIEFAVGRFLEAPQPPVRATLSWQSLPQHVYPQPGLAPLGSSYVRVRVDGAGDNAQLRVWLRGEPGPRWSLAAVQLADDGRELGRMLAPARKTPKGYLPIVLSPDAAEVLVVVTRLPVGLPDADTPVAPDAHYKLIVDRG